MQGMIKFIQLLIRMHPTQTGRANHLTDDDSIFLFHEALVPLLVRTPARKGNLLTHTRIGDRLVEKLPTSIRIESQDRKRKASPSTLEGRNHRFSSTVEQRQRFRPASGKHRSASWCTGSHPSIALHNGPADPPPENIVPLSERADGDLLLEQRTRFGR